MITRQLMFSQTSQPFSVSERVIWLNQHQVGASNMTWQPISISPETLQTVGLIVTAVLGLIALWILKKLGILSLIKSLLNIAVPYSLLVIGMTTSGFAIGDMGPFSMGQTSKEMNEQYMRDLEINQNTRMFSSAIDGALLGFGMSLNIIGCCMFRNRCK